jgi:hypothetical protein
MRVIRYEFSITREMPATGRSFQWRLTTTRVAEIHRTQKLTPNVTGTKLVANPEVNIRW